MGELPKLTPRERQVFDALMGDFESAWPIGRRAGLSTYSAGETAAKFCNRLVKLGLAEKGGTRMFPVWRRAPSTPLPKGETPNG